MAVDVPPHRRPDVDAAASRSWRSATSGCTSRAWAATTPTTRSRSSRAARAATSTTSTATATSTASPALFCVQRRPRPRRARRGGGRARSRSSTSTRTGATPTRARSSSPTRIAALAPGDLNRVFFTSGGSEAVESALKLARNYHRSHGNGQKHKVIAREIAYHGTTLGALAATGHHRRCAPSSSRSSPGGCHVAEHQQLPLARGPRPALGGGPDRGADRVRGPGDGRRGDPRAGPERRRLHRRRRTATSSACARSATATTCC